VSVSMDLERTRMRGATQAALREAIGQVTLRNRALRAQRRSLLQLAGWDDHAAFCSLKERAFRNMVFKFFFPPECAFQPLDSMHGASAEQP